MTLRARLTAAFLVVVLGPVLLGSVFVGLTVTTVTKSRSQERMDLAQSAVRTMVGVACQRLKAAADQAALSKSRRELETVVQHRFASAVVVTSASGATTEFSGNIPPYPWADCFADHNGSSNLQTSTPQAGDRPGGLSVRAEILDSQGRIVGYATAIDPVTGDFISQLASAARTPVGLFDAGPSLSAERATDIAAVTSTARNLSAGTTGRTANGRYVRRLDPENGQPLTLVLSVPAGASTNLYAALAAVVLTAGLLAIIAAWTLARSTARPLTELAQAVDRVAHGDLDARAPVGGGDEIGRLGETFNRMTRETQGYIQALTASRDQLRTQLGVMGDTLSGTHDLNRILRAILQTAMAATGAKAGVVLLTDSSGGVLVGRCAEGRVQGRADAAHSSNRAVTVEITELRLRIGEGLLGEVAATGEPRRGRIDRDATVLAEHEPQCLTYIAVPFTAPAVGPTTGLELSEAAEGSIAGEQHPVRGVLAMYDRHGFDEFDDSDLVNLRTFAGQAAVALNNVRVHEEAQRLSLTDALTGLSNYRYLRESLRREVERASRFQHSLAVLMLDLDHFKEINDTYGHVAGDAVLAEFARRVRVEIREVDLAFRQGGEEFVVLLPETDEPGAMVVAARLLDAVRRNPVLVVSGQDTPPLQISVTVSVGIAVYPAHGQTGLAVLEAADEALYAAKAAGRDTSRLAELQGGSTGG